MKVRLACVAVAVVCLLGPTQLSADVVIDWNNVLLEAIRVARWARPAVSGHGDDARRDLRCGELDR